MSLFGVVSIYVGSEKLSAKTAIVFHHYSSNGAKHETHNSSPYGVVAESDLGNVPGWIKGIFLTGSNPLSIYIFKKYFCTTQCTLLYIDRFVPVPTCATVS